MLLFWFAIGSFGEVEVGVKLSFVLVLKLKLFVVVFIKVFEVEFRVLLDGLLILFRLNRYYIVLFLLFFVNIPFVQELWKAC